MKRFTRFIVRNRIRDWKDVKNQEVRSQYGVLEGWTSIVVNLILFLIKGILGIITKSVSLIADSFHTFSDTLTSLVILVSFKMAKKPSDRGHPFGHGRMEAVSTLVVAVLLIVVGIEIGKTAIGRIVHPEKINVSWFIIAVIVGTIIIKELTAQFSRELGLMIGSAALEADFWHHRSDAISSLFVIIALVGQRFGWIFLDGFAGVLVAGIIIFTGWDIAKKGIDDLLGKPPSLTLVEEIKQMIKQVPEILDVHDVIIHQYGQSMVMSLHIQLSDTFSLKEAHGLAEQVEKMIYSEYQTYATVHIDPINIHDPDIQKLNEQLNGFLETLPEHVSYHDLRFSDGKESRSVFFDLVVDPEMKEEGVKQLKNQLYGVVQKTCPNVKRIIIEVEPRYAL